MTEIIRLEMPEEDFNLIQHFLSEATKDALYYEMSQMGKNAKIAFGEARVDKVTL